MTTSHSDALVFFGATGDLAYMKIFPALQAMIRRGCLDVPIIGWPSPAGVSINSKRGPWLVSSLRMTPLAPVILLYGVHWIQRT